MSNDTFHDYQQEAQPIVDEALQGLQLDSELDVPKIMKIMQGTIVKLTALARKLLGDEHVDARQAEIAEAIIKMADDYVDNMDLSGRLPAVQRAIRNAAKREIADKVPALVDQYLKGA